MDGGGWKRAGRSGLPRVDPAERRYLLDLARATLEAARDTGEAERLAEASEALAAPGAVFVTLRRRASGELRGCCGQVVPQTSLVQSVVSMTLASARDDPRFPPVSAEEVGDLFIDITVMGPLEPIRPEWIVIGRHGLMIRRGARQGLLLPRVATDRSWDRERFLERLCRKAGLPPGSWKLPDVVLEAFEAISWGEEDRTTLS